MKCEAKKYVYDFQKFQRKRYFGETIFKSKTRIIEVDEKQSNSLKKVKFNDTNRPRAKADK